jgi:glycosyltransferase involved in cell wall biosynthesis
MDRGAKGTRFVVEAIRRLENEGVPVDFRLVEGLQREAARRLYEEADLVVDQVLVGWYGGLAVEAMALGKPVVAYIRDGDLRFVPPELRTELPVIDATPDSLSSVLADWLTSRRGELGELGRRSRAFVERWHDPRAIAARLKGDYEEVLAAAGR